MSETLTTATTTKKTLANPEVLEHIFQRLEAESAERARREEELERSQRKQELSLRQEASDVVPETVPAFSSQNTLDSATTKMVKERRRGSISISRFGYPPECASIPTTPLTESQAQSNRPSRSPSVILTKSTFYQLDAVRYHGRQQPLASASQDSFASLNDDPDAHFEDEMVTVQSITIAPKQSLSKAISRRLSRARDIALPPAVTGQLVIGVAVEEATIEHHAEDPEVLHSPVLTSTVITAGNGTGTLKTKKSFSRLISGSDDDSSSTKSTTAWIEKARDITTKFKRRSIAALNSAMN